MSKRESTVNQYLSEYLKGKSAEQCGEFVTRSLDKQYAAIMAWRYRREGKRGGGKKKKSGASGVSGLTSAEVIKHIQSLPDLINMIEYLPDADFDVMYSGLEAARHALENYHQTKRNREIAALEEERDALQRKIDELKSI